MKIYLLLLLVLGLSACSKKNKVEGSVHIHGQIKDEYSGAPVTNLTLTLYEIRKGSTMSQNYLWDISPSSISYTIDANGNYQLDYITDKTSDCGYSIGWQCNDEKYFYRFDKNYTSSYSSNICLSLVNNNDVEFNIPMIRNSFQKVHLVDQVPYALSDTITYGIPSGKFRLYNLNHDTTCYLTLPPNAKTQYNLLKYGYSNIDTLQKGWLNTTNNGDTISTEIFY